MRTQLKSALALVMALLICVSVFAACKGKGDPSDTSSIDIPVVSVPSEAEINLEAGTIQMAYGSTFADLKQDLVDQGKFLADQGEVLQLFQADKVTEITDETTPLENGMVVVKKDANGTVVFELTLEVLAAVESVVVNSDGTITVTLQDGTTSTVTSDGQPADTTNPGNNDNQGGDNQGTTTPSGDNGGNQGGGDEPVAPPANPGDEPTQVSDPTAVDTKNNYTLTVQAADDESDMLQAVVEFQQKYKNVKIRLQRAEGGRHTSLDQLKMQLASNNAADVVIMDSVYVAAAGYDGYLLDLQQFGAEKVREQFIPSCWESVKSQLAGSTAQFGMPCDCNTILMFYNKTLLDRAGITRAPENWAQFTTALDLLRSVPGVTTPFHLMVNFKESLGQKNYMAFQWMMYLWRLGGDVLTPDLKSAAFQNAEGIQALQMYVDMVTKYGVSNAAYGTGDPFGTGAAGFDMMTNNLYKSYMENPSRTDTYGVVMLPELKAGVPRYSGLGLYAMALPNKVAGAKGDALKTATETAKWAYKFAEHYTTGLNYQLEYGRTSYLMPSLKAGEGQGVFQGDYWTIAYRQLETSKYRPGVKNWDAIETSIAEAINKAVNNERSPQEALKAAAQQTNRQLA